MALRGKMQDYVLARANGLRPHDAGIAAGYSKAGLKVIVSRLEKRQDIQAEIRRLQKGEAPEEGEGEAKAKWALKDSYENPLELLLDLMNNPNAPATIRYQAAKDALPYVHARKGESGKKEQAKESSKKLAKVSKFRMQNKPSHLRSVA